METTRHRSRPKFHNTAIIAALVPIFAAAPAAVQAADPQVPGVFAWRTVANSANAIPGGDGRKFNSFNQPSVNAAGLVVLRGRSKGGDGAGEPLRGIYARSMSGKAGVLTSVFDTITEVPPPNNTTYNNRLGTFTEFPAFPRIGLDNSTMTTRAQSKPVWTYTATDGTETRVGSSGVYALRLGERVTAAAQLGAVPGFDYFSVPGATPGTKFDQFPGAPAVANTNAVVFKGNYTEGTSKTGIFFRPINSSATQAKTEVIASSDTLIPGLPVGGARFGSTAPPSASPTDAVFLGLDNEEAPTAGGIYRAPLASRPPLQTLVGIGSQVPGELPGAVFNRLGEGLSYDGRFVAFWGAWGSAVQNVTLACPVDGQAAVIAFCHSTYPNGHVVAVPVQQGFFLHDTQLRRTYAVVKTGSDYADFLYWTYSGRPPGVGSESDSEDFEAPRWRSAAFAATYGQGGAAQVAFKGRKQADTVTDGIYLTLSPSSSGAIRTVMETGSPAALIDPAAPNGASVVTVGIERDGLRNGWLALTASMLYVNEATSESEGWAGVYVTRTVK